MVFLERDSGNCSRLANDLADFGRSRRHQKVLTLGRRKLGKSRHIPKLPVKVTPHRRDDPDEAAGGQRREGGNKTCLLAGLLKREKFLELIDYEDEAWLPGAIGVSFVRPAQPQLQ
jgi:hypothetical protein